ncbi:MAG TPA: prepilin-type N-terminal cleavage/methylation domain-containing protein [Candidatus Omnitrophota bacterium]|nr:prepilin-type N-terminal cleavage/methylation domain-containing protein [Candidatus Omnitrophota bacterium]HRZ15402.1 prepilin-type N-terminal cleavage/methylation domain-containing protein [Candidatus Omnitrophota bacterium]
MHRTGSRGVTIIEILVALFILALVMAAFLNVFVIGKKFIFHSRSRVVSAELGKHFFEQPGPLDVRQDTWGTNCVSNNNNCVNPAPLTVDSIVYNGKYESSAINTPDGTPTTLRRVVVNVTWNESDF